MVMTVELPKATEAMAIRKQNARTPSVAARSRFLFDRLAAIPDPRIVTERLAARRTVISRPARKTGMSRDIAR